MIISRNFSLAPDFIPDVDLAAVIGYKSVLPSATLTASEESTGFEVDYIKSYLTGDYWRTDNAGDNYVVIDGELSEADYYGIAGHNLAGYSVLLQLWDGEYWNTIDEILVPDSAPVMRLFTPTIGGRWRFFFPSGPALSIAVIFLGKATYLERGVFVGHRPIVLNRRDSIINSTSEGGQFIGRSLISEGGETSIDLNNLSAEWVRETWVPFWLHGRLRPFFFAWHSILYPWEVTYCWSTSVPQPEIIGHEFYKISLSVRGLI